MCRQLSFQSPNYLFFEHSDVKTLYFSLLLWDWEIQKMVFEEIHKTRSIYTREISSLNQEK